MLILVTGGAASGKSEHAERLVCEKAQSRLYLATMQPFGAAAQARMLEAIEPELTEQEADITRRGRNAQAKHAAPKHADPADYAHATGLEALWGYLYVTKQTDRLDTLIRLAILRTEDIWHKQS